LRAARGASGEVSKSSQAQKEGLGRPGIPLGPRRILRVERRHKLYKGKTVLKFLTNS